MKSFRFNKNFALHWASLTTASIGSYFTMVALPWLSLSLTDDDASTMAIVLATHSLCQGFFILFGGALADRFSALKMLRVTRILFVLTLYSLAVTVYFFDIPVWLLVLYAFLLGTLGGFGIPASQSLLPSLVSDSALPRANGVVMATTQLTQIVGPLVAGWLIWFIRNGISSWHTDVGSTAFSVAFFVDATAVFLAATLLWGIRIPSPTKPVGKVTDLLSDGIRFCWRNQNLRLVLLYLVLVSFFMHGPLLTALPLITKLVFGLSEAGYGNFYAVLGLGTVIGAAITSVKSPRPRALGQVVLTCDVVSGACVCVLASSTSIWLTFGALATMGICMGIIMVAGVSWFQTRVPGSYMGRVMSILMFCVVGLVPVSASLTGFLIDATSISLVLAVAGISIIAVSGVGFLIPKVRNMGDCPRASQSEEKPMSVAT